MKTQAIIIVIFSLFFNDVPLMGQFKNLKKELAKLTADSKSFTKEEAADAIKEALSNGIEKGVSLVSKPDGYFENPLIKIPFPPEADEIESAVRKLPGGNQKCNEVIWAINRSAELASKEALAIFLIAIKQMSLTDAISIVKGEEDSATKYLEDTTTEELIIKFKPIIEDALSKTGATKYWGDVMNLYNKIPFVKKINPDLTDYYTRSATGGLFEMIAQEERNIRSNNNFRTSDLLKKVFGS